MVLTSFAWVHERALAGSGRPGLLCEIEEDLEFIRELGFRLIVTLTEQALPEEYADDQIELLHFPIPDMGIPMPRTLQPICDRINAAVRDNRPVLVHCRAGLGRTGVVLACCLVEQGLEPSEAIQRLRTINRYYIQNGLQEGFINHYARFIQQSPPRRRT